MQQQELAMDGLRMALLERHAARMGMTVNEFASWLLLDAIRQKFKRATPSQRVVYLRRVK